MASHKQQESTTVTRVLLNFPCGHYRLWKVNPQGAAYLQSIYVKQGATVEEGIVLTDQQPCWACRWLETLKRFYLLPAWENEDVLPGVGAAAVANSDNTNKSEAELRRQTETTQVIRAHMATAIIALFIQHPLLHEQQLAMLSCLWDRACVELGKKIDFDFGRLADDVYEVIIALTDAAVGDGDDEVAAFLNAGRDLNVVKLVAKIEKESMNPRGPVERAPAPKTGPDARGVEGMIYRGQMLEKMAAPSARAPPSQTAKEGAKEEVSRRGILARLFAKMKK
ncbi:hypothetical protein PG993_011357 [Apiospora rasikravindrae]|uniref:Uncharacterized protein n=1 Tax=Apiospora rasikravindrae TaxID=990691 RepID=A0ABR1SDZ8_9PEZI